MLKTLLFKKKVTVMAVGIVAVVLLAAVSYVLTRPANEAATTEASVVEPERQEHIMEESVAGQPDESEEDLFSPLDVETLTDDNEQETIEEVGDTKNEETEENDEDESDGEESNQAQTQYIGRQPPEGYVEPEGDKNYVPRLLEYKDTYQSNIVVILDDIWAIDHRDYAWFHPMSPYFLSGWEVYQFLIYAILTYYDGDIPCDYYVNLEEDVHNELPRTSMIFEVQMHGDRPLNICLDAYNYKIRVEEGIVKED